MGNRPHSGRVFVMQCYTPHGGAYMVYHLARILCLYFEFEGISVSDNNPKNTPTHGIFNYDLRFPSMNVEEMLTSISDSDILIAGPAFSSYCFGLRCRGKKIMYIQSFTTFKLLDCRFDHYISVSDFVQKVISNTYDIDTIVIPPFIHMDTFPPRKPWQERPPASILVLLKGDNTEQTLLLDRLKQLLFSRVPDLSLDNILDSKMCQQELMARIGECRYFLTLSSAEGFGLMPLEAMAMGATVVGFDGFGGRDYMRPGVNCAVKSYPDIEGVADQISVVLSNQQYGNLLAQSGILTAQQSIYTYGHFKTAWQAQFRQFLN
jgi:hypothetical protein